MLFKKNTEIKKDDLIPREEFEKLKDLANVHQDYLNNIYVFYDLKPNHYLEKFRALSYELLRFFDKVCFNHDLEYWLDYSTLLGAIRHNDFIPWDDDLDVGMMRKDYLKLLEILPDEIERNELNDLTFDYTSKKWFQLNYYHLKLNKKIIGINIFPNDYLKSVAANDFEEKYNKAKSSYNNAIDFNNNIADIYSNLNMTFDKEKRYTHGIDSVHGKNDKYSFKILESDNLFPLQEISFGKYKFPVPNNSFSYIRSIYGKKFIKIPRKKPKNNSLIQCSNIENIEEILKTSYEKIKEIND